MPMKIIEKVQIKNFRSFFGSPAAIRDTFIGFQKYLYE